MAIDQPNIVDFIGIDPKANEVILVIADHLEWTNDDQSDKLHMLFLQNKLNDYLEFAASGQIYKAYPDANGKGIAIKVMAKFSMNSEGKKFFERVRLFVLELGYRLEFNGPRDRE